MNSRVGRSQSLKRGDRAWQTVMKDPKLTVEELGWKVENMGTGQSDGPRTDQNSLSQRSWDDSNPGAEA